MKQHLKTWEGSINKNIHIGHLWTYISAWAYSAELKETLLKEIELGLSRAKSEGKVEVVDMDGEMFFAIYPSSMISLCLRWKDFELVELKHE